jgi:hypothetical protein
MIGSEVSDLVRRLESDAAELAELVVAFAPELRTAPLGDEFCVVEHACHLRDLERDGFTPRIRSVVEHADPLLMDFDGSGVAAASDYRSENVFAALNAFLEARKRNTDLLQTLAETELERVGHYAGREPITLAAVVAGMLDHDRDHLDRLAAMLMRVSSP